MPYIKQDLRDQVDDLLIRLENILFKSSFDPGLITYVFYRIINEMFDTSPRYKTIALIRGILTGTMDEFNRKVVHPYEDEKIKENGDVS